MSRRIRTLIVDDEPLARTLIRSLLAGDGEVEIVGECSNGKEAARTIARLKPELVFLDVQMPGGSGFDALAGIAEEVMPHVVFITAFDRYALRAFEANAFDYLLKPFTKDRFRDSLRRAKAGIRRRRLGDLAGRIAALASSYTELRASSAPLPTDDHPETLIVREGSALHPIPVGEIVWVEAANQYARIHTSNRSHLVTRSLCDLERDLDPIRFVRVHRSVLVNLRFVAEVRAGRNGAGSLLMKGGTRLPVSRRRRSVIDRIFGSITALRRTD